MPLTLNCPKCHKPFRVRDESVGGRVRCPSCGAVLQVPAALSPASHVGLDLPKIDSPSGEMTGAHRPMAEDVPRTAQGTMSDMMFAGPRGDAPATEQTAGTALPSPPSIKGGRSEPPPPRSLPTAPPTNASRPSMPLPPVPSRVPTAPRPPAPRGGRVQALPPDLAYAWSKVRGGLGLVRWGLFLCLVPLVASLGHAAWILFDPNSAQGAGFLGRPELNRVQEVALAYTAIPLGLAALCLFFGRLRCGAAPSDSHAKGLARGAAFFTFLALLSIGVYVAQTYFDAGTKAKVPPEVLPHVAPIAWYLIFPSIILAELLTLLFVGQIGWPVGRPSLQKGVAGFFLIALFAPTAAVIAERFYPFYFDFRYKMEDHGWKSPLDILLLAFTGEEEGTANKMMIWTVVVTAVAILIVLRYAGVLGAGRRAIRKYMEGEV
jgi:predicted Zn finger-like uncharacterized protein